MANDEQDLRKLFQTWFDQSEKKDIDGVMSIVAPDIVSYEHDAPLQYVGKQGVREVCQAGIDATPEAFRWDVPEMKIIVRGDIAIQWGLNRMAPTKRHEPSEEMWSHGTRVFQKIDGRWLMIHQHVSFPYDPKSEKARLDLKP